MPKGKLLGPAIISCQVRGKVLELPRGTPVIEVLSRAAAVFGAGHIVDRAGDVVTLEHPKLAGGYYTWVPEGAIDKDPFHVCWKGPLPRDHGHAIHVRPFLWGNYNYCELTEIAGYPWFIWPKYLILGDPELLWIYPTDGTVFIDRSKLGDWGTRTKPIPLMGVGSVTSYMSYAKPSYPAYGVCSQHLRRNLLLAVLAAGRWGIFKELLCLHLNPSLKVWERQWWFG